MEAQLCWVCRAEKPLTPEYWPRNPYSKSGFQSYCTQCVTLDGPVQKFWGTEANKKRIRELKESTPCADCGEYYPFYVMQFDHLDRYVKRAAISRLSSSAWETVKDEMAKCVIVCANCHAFRTYYRTLGNHL